MVVFAHSVTLWALTTLAPATASSAPASAPAATAPTPAASTDAAVDTPDLKSTSTTSAAPARAPTPGEADPKASTNDDPRAGERLRPRWEPALFADHEVNLGRARFKLGTGLVIESADGRYSLATRLRAQLLYTMEREHEEAPAHGLQLRRARLQFKGNVFHKDFKFKTELALSPRDTGFDGAPHQTPILDWYFDLTFLRDLSVRIGQYKVPYSRQRVISSGDLQLVDRTLANGEFNLDRDIGLDLRSMDFLGMGRMRYYAGVYLGEGRDQFNLSTFELFYLARVEVLPLGLFEDYEEADFERSLKPRLSLGAAYAFVDGAARNRGILGATPSDGGTTDYHNVTVDAVFMVAGFSLFTEFYYRKGQRKFGDATVLDELGEEVPAPQEAPRDGIGLSGQAGYLIPRLPLELAARYSVIAPLGADTSAPRRDEAGGGLSFYIAGHPVKLQLDYFARFDDRLIRAVDHIVRLQLQASF